MILAFMRIRSLALLLALPGIADAAAPDDFVVQQRSFRSIRALEAWNYTTCSRAMTVAIIDSGVDLDHPDLRDNLWRNAAETPHDGIDDDGNGYVDDVHGWDFVSGDGEPRDLLGRGTHLAGIVGAVGGNGIGVTGLCHEVTLLPIRIHGRGNVGDLGAPPEVGARAVRYATANGARVILLTMTTTSDHDGLRTAIRDAIAGGAVVVVPAGDGARNLDASPLYPAAWDEPGLISVASVDEGAKLALSSNRGRQTVSMVAPGVNVYSTLPGSLSGVMSGTPQAAAHVAGGAAMLLSLNPQLGAAEAAEMIVTLSSNREVLENTVKSASILDLGLLIAEKRNTVEARITGPRKVKVGEKVSYDGRESEGAIIEYLWKFGDPDIRLGPVVPQQWDRPGSVGVELMVRTHDGRSASSRITVQIEGNDAFTSCGCALGSPGGSGSVRRGSLLAAALLLGLGFRRFRFRRRREVLLEPLRAGADVPHDATRR